jgi:hypothetical protein
MTADAEAEGLWRNCRDSLAHSLGHFSELRSTDYGFHNRKWIILSVHHTAEVFCNFLLRRADPNYPPDGWYLSLSRAMDLLQKHPAWHQLSIAEREVVTTFLPPLIPLRNMLMHRAAPEAIEVSEAALATLALLILVYRQTGVSTDEFWSQSFPIEYEVVDELRVQHLDTYTRFVERVVAEEYDWIDVAQCDYCGGQTRPRGESECRACFHESETSED